MSRAGWMALGLALGLGCSVPFSDEHRYTCAGSGDCGGDGFICIADKAGVHSCCKPTGPEICGDGIDNDCNGLTDGDDTWPAETCNGKDDNCNGKIDEGFYFDYQEANCGSCTNQCTATQSCVKGQCVP